MTKTILILTLLINILYSSGGNLHSDLVLEEDRLLHSEEHFLASENDRGLFPNPFHHPGLNNTRDNHTNMNLVNQWAAGYDGYPSAFSGFKDTLFYNKRDSLIIADFTDPSNPITIGSAPLPESPSYGSFLIQNDNLFVSDYVGGLRIFDISDLSNPIEIGAYEYDGPGWAYNTVITGDTAFVASRGEGLKVLDISDLTNPVEIGSYESDNLIDAVAEKDGYAIIGDRDGVIRVLDFSSSDNPDTVGEYLSGEWVRKLQVDGDYLHAQHYSAQKYRIYDISDLTNLSLVSEYNLQNQTYYIRVDGNFAYFPYHGALEIVDITDPSNPYQSVYFELESLRRVDGTVIGNSVYSGDVYGIRVLDGKNTTQVDYDLLMIFLFIIQPCIYLIHGLILFEFLMLPTHLF